MSTRRRTLPARLLPGLLLALLLAWQGGEAVRAVRHDGAPDVVLAHRRGPSPRPFAAAVHLATAVMLPATAPSVPLPGPHRAPALVRRGAAIHPSAAPYRRDYPRPPPSEA
ncbi:MAG TPA: hypothetical protein VFQ38_22420 [Longimicrobiales bacterium]|nr:hypothetical protein [Longimicrobiales bacterium]